MLAPVQIQMNHPASPPGRLVIDYEKIVSFFVFIFVACTNVSMFDPSPYDIASLFAIPLWFLGGVSVHRSFIVFASLILAHLIFGFLALIPYWSSAESSLYQFQSAYLVMTGMFYALYTASRTEKRVELLLKAYTLSSLICAIAAILGFFDVAGLAPIFDPMVGRPSGTLKDPNVTGPALILPFLYLLQSFILGRAKHALFNAIIALTLFSSIFLTFSRGAYGALVISFVLMMASIFLTTNDPRRKARIIFVAAIILVIVIAFAAVILSLPEAQEIFSSRATVTKDYDEGPTGRFGNQMRSLPMLLDLFQGFGPLRFRLVFGLDPHNSYIGAFANAGWLGGFVYLILVIVSIRVGWRMLFTPSPVLRHAQLFVPIMISLFFQGFQIDVDHWRHSMILIGVVWGLEAARQKYEEREPSVRLKES